MRDDSCGCCEGIQPETPVAVVNRPGLDALAYRVGTHGRFLETMLARLAGHLGALNTRSTEDPSIALLDAWASVADVLTFYQERIANEGYLRTATERRSVVELGRQVGYRLRPGVAATAYLAYELEAGARVRLDTGNQVQSMPGPGELPQTFETVEDLDARGEWSLLQVRQTRTTDPSALEELSGGETGALYFKGITTGLSPNDPLLADFGSRQQLYRVIEVEPDGAANRTRAVVRLWHTTSAPSAPRAPEPVVTAAPPAVVEEEPTPEELVLEVVSHYTDPTASGVRRTSVIAGRVVQLLERLRTNVMMGMGGAELAEFLADEVVPSVRAEHALARRGRSAPLQTWLEHLSDDLDELVARIAAARSGHGRSLEGPAAGADPGGPAARTTVASAPAATATTTTIGDIVDSLAEPPSVPPANPLRLDRSIETSFAASSDVLPSLLTAMRPELAGTLYDAWRNVPATPQSALRVYALRTRAAPFGHNAPPQPVTNSQGLVVGTREWSLEKPSGERVPEPFEVVVVLPVAVLSGRDGRDGSARVTVRIRDASREVAVPVDDLLHGPLTIDFPQAAEQVVVTFTLPGDSPPTAAALRVVFVRRALTFEATVDATARREERREQGRVTWSSEGSDPTAVRFTLTTSEPGSPGEGEELGVPVLRMTISGLNRTPAGMVPTEQADVVSLDATYPAVVPGGWIVVERPQEDSSPPADPVVIRQVRGVRDASRDDYGITGRSTFVQMDGPWLRLGRDGDTFAVIRGSAVFAGSEALELVQEPLDPVAEPLCQAEIPLERLYDGLQPGRWLIVSGERTDVGAGDGDAAPVRGVVAAELVMLGGVRQEFDAAEPGAATRTTLVLATPLAYCYRRDSVTVHGNVARATHGKTSREVLGNGDGGQANQAFQLKQKPLTLVSAATPSGVESTLAVYVDDVRWHEADTPVGLVPTDRRFVTATADDQTTTVVFGNGREGARLPTGQENVTAVYRFGLGRAGNVRAGQLSLLGTRPQGVVSVSNPLPATGGADREDRDQARRNIPLAVTALSRIVSVQDYADFARTFAGIGKASAVKLTDGRRKLVHLTIAGSDDIPIDPSSELYRNLRAALRAFGDPLQPLRIEVRRLRLLVMAANVRVDPDHRWEVVAPAVRTALLDRLGFARRELGQDVTRSEVLSTIQAVDGVTYVDLDVLDTVDEEQVRRELSAGGSGTFAAHLGLHPRLRASLATHARHPVPHIVPAELIYLTSAVPETLILEVVE